jgi:hypothetical protein
MSILKWNPKYNMYYGNSDSTIPDNMMIGDLVYFFDTQKNMRYNGTSFVQYFLNTDTTLEVGDIEIGAVELKDAATSNRAVIDSSGNIAVAVKEVPATVATAAKQDTLIGHVDGLETLVTSLETLLTSIKATDGIKKITDALPAGTNLIGKTGAKSFKVSANFTRPSDNNIYAENDAITNSTSSPAIMSFDLSSFGATNGQFFCITNARVISSVKPTALALNANIWMFNVTFSATNDNAEFSIDDSTVETGGIVIPCFNTYQTALNHRCVSDSGQWLGQLATNATMLYFALQASNAYTPQSGEVIYVVLEGVLL